MHANEIVLLAYYIAAVHIEEAFHGRVGHDSSYEPFGGIVLTDTFNLHTDRTGFPREWLPDNSERAERQQGLPIQVIVGNPPWSAGQRSSSDDNPNVGYPEVEGRVAETYAARSTATLKNSLYDTYKMAIRWASDRIGDQGVVALVTNGSWIDGNVDSGVRACLAEEFNSIYVLNLRGNQRTQGERSKREGGKVFGQGSRAPVAITILVSNPDAKQEGCYIRYRDVGDYLKREEKLTILREASSIAGIPDWRTITLDRHNDWIGQRDEAYQQLFPIGSKDAKSGKDEGAIFRLYSRGLATSRDAYLYNSSRQACAKNASGVVQDYMGALRVLEQGQQPNLEIDQLASRHSSNLRWDQALKDNLSRGKVVEYMPGRIWKTQYRPFVKQYCYVDYVLVNRKYQMDSIFPNGDTGNRAICVPGVGSTKPFSVLAVDTMPDIQLMFNGQYLPRYRFEPKDERQPKLLGTLDSLDRIDNVTEAALIAFRRRYDDSAITKDEIFDHIYGVLHSPLYRERFANDLAKGLPRVPMAPTFEAFAEAGRKLVELHIGYETCDTYPLQVESDSPAEPAPEHYRIGSRAMRFADAERTVLVVNDHIRISGVPPQAHKYVVNGRTPLEWFIDRYRIKKDRESGIVNDPNDWFADPKDLVAAIRRIVYVSVETVSIVASLPDPMEPSTKSGVLAALRRSPLVGADIDLTRPYEESREVKP